MVTAAIGGLLALFFDLEPQQVIIMTVAATGMGLAGAAGYKVKKDQGKIRLG